MTTTTTRTTTKVRGLAAALLAALVLATACTSTPRPSVPSDVEGARVLANEAAALLLRLAAYDYALTGTLTGQRTHVVSPERYASVMRDAAAKIQGFTGNALNATLNTNGPLRDRLVRLADGMVEVSRAANQYADGGDPAVFAKVVAGVAQGWEDVHALNRLVRPVDEDLFAAIERGKSIVVEVKPGRVYGLTVGPFASSAEADQAAARIGKVEHVSRTSPFVVRVGTYPDHAAGEAAVSAVSAKGFTGLLVEEQRYTFSRSGPVPEAELWREPERVFDTWEGSRRVAVASGGTAVVTGADDGTIAIFSGDGRLRALPQLNAGIAQLAFSDDGLWVVAGGITLVHYLVPQGTAYGVPVRLQERASQMIYVPGANYFAGIAGGPTEGVVSGRTPDGLPLAHPFPIRTIPAEGGVLAANGWGQLYIGTSTGGNTRIEVLLHGPDRRLHGVVAVPGVVSQLVVTHEGQHGAVLTDKGVFRFGPHAPDPGKTVERVSDPVREIAIAADGTLYLMAPTKLTALDARGETVWSSALVDGRRLVLAGRPVVLDGVDRVVTFTPTGAAEDLGSTGTVQDISASRDGKRVAVLADGRRAQIFKLP